MGVDCGNDFRNEGKGLGLKEGTIPVHLFLLVTVRAGKIGQG